MLCVIAHTNAVSTTFAPSSGTKQPPSSLRTACGVVYAGICTLSADYLAPLIGTTLTLHRILSALLADLELTRFLGGIFILIIIQMHTLLVQNLSRIQVKLDTFNSQINTIEIKDI